MNSFLLILAVSQSNPKFLPANCEKVNVPGIEYSDWYYLKLTSETQEESCQDKEDPSSQILENLSTKLSVPSTSFLITSLDTLSAGIISTNLSLLHPLPGVHNNLSNLQISSPEFYICHQKFSLALLLHDRTDIECHHGRENVTYRVSMWWQKNHQNLETNFAQKKAVWDQKVQRST